MVPSMLVGLDFDNTIACYDAVYRSIVDDMEVVPSGTPANKTAIRDWLRQNGQEDAWTRLQGYVYGDGMAHAQPFPGVVDFITACRDAGLAVCIISHRTREPYAGPKVDLHAAARRWLEGHAIVSETGAGLTHDGAYFELTKEDKLARIEQQGCDWFVDDLPEFLSLPGFPDVARRILFDPHNVHGAQAQAAGLRALRSWPEIQHVVLSEVAQA